MSNLYGVLVTYRRPHALKVMLSRVSGGSGLQRLVVVDNDPRTSSAEAVRAGEIPTDYLPMPQNLGPAGGIARGMMSVLTVARDDDWIVLLDDDDPPPDGALLATLKRFGDTMLERDHRTAGVALGGARFNRRTGRLTAIGEKERVGREHLDYLGGNRFPLYLVRVIREVGVFRGDLFFGFEELEYGLRLTRAGYSLYMDGSLLQQVKASLHRKRAAWRPAGRASRRLDEPTWRRYYSLRNQIWILRFHRRRMAVLYSLAVQAFGKPLVNLPLAPRRAIKHLMINGRATWDALLGHMGKTVDPED
jgi:GT2 family glycosyltransferase